MRSESVDFFFIRRRGTDQLFAGSENHFNAASKWAV
jgi:hypothetical protein